MKNNNERYSNKEPIDISMEPWRQYEYSDGRHFCVMKPEKLYIRDTGGHRVIAGDTAYIIASGWVAISIPAKALEF